VSVEPETGLVIADTITAGNTGDGGVATELLADEDDPVEVLADAAYGGGHTRADLDDARHTTVIKPAPLRPAVPGGFDRDDFAIDHDNRTVTCPNNQSVVISAKATPPSVPAAGPARCATGAPPAGRVAACTSPSMTATSSMPAGRPRHPSSSRPTGGGGRWSNGRSPG
jgi:hypothetical protein